MEDKIDFTPKHRAEVGRSFWLNAFLVAVFAATLALILAPRLLGL